MQADFSVSALSSRFVFQWQMNDNVNGFAHSSLDLCRKKKDNDLGNVSKMSSPFLVHSY